MRSTLAGLVLAVCLPHRADAGADCARAAGTEELRQGIPAHLLGAIGRVESASWPWAVNVDGAGYRFDTRAQAVAFVRDAQRAGGRRIDVGCFQIDLFWHPDAFTDLDDAFDPASNARYAASFLAGLHATTGDWGMAVARYHSADPERGLPYRDLVLGTGTPAWAPEGPVRRFGMMVLVPGMAATLPGLPRVIGP